jgi:hypothetical protein
VLVAGSGAGCIILPSFGTSFGTSFDQASNYLKGTVIASPTKEGEVIFLMILQMLFIKPSLAAELYLLAPWKYMEETDIFGVQTALTGKTYFISIMGSAGQVRAVSAYEGNNALEQFWEMENRPDVEPETIMLIPHIMLSFDNKKNIDNTQKEIFKITGPHPGKLKEWPDLKRVIPGLSCPHWEPLMRLLRS